MECRNCGKHAAFAYVRRRAKDFPAWKKVGTYCRHCGRLIKL